MREKTNVLNRREKKMNDAILHKASFLMKKIYINTPRKQNVLNEPGRKSTKSIFLESSNLKLYMKSKQKNKRKKKKNITQRQNPHV